MEELAFEAVDFAKALVERKVSVLFVQNDGMIDLGEVESDLMHPSCLCHHSYERGVRI